MQRPVGGQDALGQQRTVGPHLIEDRVLRVFMGGVLAMWVGMGGKLLDGEESGIHAGELVAGGFHDTYSNLDLICAGCLRVIGTRRVR